MNKKSIIELKNLTKVFVTSSGDKVEALEDFSLDIIKGECIAVLGPSGCGKSTLMMIAAGLLPATCGKVLIEEEEVSGPYTNLGIVFQNHVLLEWRNSLDNVLFQIEMRKLNKKEYLEKAQELFCMVSLTGFEDKYPHELSGGMRQRVAICRALLHDPPFLFLDEPFGALDALTRDQLCIDLEKILLKTNKTVLFITHSIQEAVLLADRIVVMTPRPGKIYKVFNNDFPRPRYDLLTGTAEYAEQIEKIKSTFIEQGILKK